MLAYIISHWHVIVLFLVALMTDVTIVFPSLENSAAYKAINNFLTGLKGGNVS